MQSQLATYMVVHVGVYIGLSSYMLYCHIHAINLPALLCMSKYYLMSLLEQRRVVQLLEHNRVV